MKILCNDRRDMIRTWIWIAFPLAVTFNNRMTGRVISSSVSWLIGWKSLHPSTLSKPAIGRRFGLCKTVTINYSRVCRLYIPNVISTTKKKYRVKNYWEKYRVFFCTTICGVVVLRKNTNSVKDICYFSHLNSRVESIENKW